MTSKRKGEHVHKTRSSRSIVALVMGLLMALALGSVPALAEGWPSGPKSITAEIVNNEYKADIEGIAEKDAVVVDAYRIATVTHDGDALSSMILEVPFKELQSLMDSGDWKKLAEGAAKVVSDGKQGNVAVRHGKLGAKIPLAAGDDQGDGVWLIMPRGASQKAGSLTAYSDKFKYNFTPSLVMLPTKDDVDDAKKLNSAYGEWVADATVEIKPERSKIVEPPDTPRKVVKTGEETTLTPFYVAMGVSGGLLALLAIQGVFSRKREADKKSA